MFVGDSVPVPVSVSVRCVRWSVVMVLLVTLLWWVATITDTRLTQQPQTHGHTQTQTVCRTQTQSEQRIQKDTASANASASDSASASEIVISMAVCGLERFEQTVVSLKSLLLQSSHGAVARIYIIHDDDATKHRLMEQIEQWPIYQHNNNNNNNTDNDSDYEIPPPAPHIHFIDLQPIIKAASSSSCSTSGSSISSSSSSSSPYSCSLLSFIPTLNLFRRCATAKLMVPVLLPHESYVIHVDTDTAWMSPPIDMLQQYKQKTQNNKYIMIGMVTETDIKNKNLNWYIDDCGFAAKPPATNKGCGFSWYRPCALNSGVMLFDISRLNSHTFHMFPELPRNSSNIDLNGNLFDDTHPSIDPNITYSQFMITLLQRYQHVATLGDQDVIIIWFHRQPQYLHHIDPRWNWRFKHDMSQLTKGLGLIHFAGSALSKSDSQYDMFRSAYHMYRDYPGWSTISSG